MVHEDQKNETEILSLPLLVNEIMFWILLDDDSLTKSLKLWCSKKRKKNQAASQGLAWAFLQDSCRKKAAFDMVCNISKR